MGDQGQGTRNPSQMLYVFDKLVKTIRDLGRIKLLDNLYAIFQNEMVDNGLFGLLTLLGFGITTSRASASRALLVHGHFNYLTHTRCVLTFSFSLALACTSVLSAAAPAPTRKAVTPNL